MPVLAHDTWPLSMPPRCLAFSKFHRHKHCLAQLPRITFPWHITHTYTHTYTDTAIPQLWVVRTASLAHRSCTRLTLTLHVKNPHCSASIRYAATRYDTNDAGQGLKSTQPFVPRKEERARCNVGCKYAYQFTYTIKAEVALKQSAERDLQLSSLSISHSNTLPMTSKCSA